MTDGVKPKGKTGFANMSPEKLRQIASKGGKSVPKEKRSFARDPKLAAAAGLKGGLAVNPKNRAFSQDRQLAASAGKKGGTSKGRS